VLYDGVLAGGAAAGVDIAIIVEVELLELQLFAALLLLPEPLLLP